MPLAALILLIIILCMIYEALFPKPSFEEIMQEKLRKRRIREAEQIEKNNKILKEIRKRIKADIKENPPQI